MSTSNKHRIIGISGTSLGGKDILARRLESLYRYRHISTGDMIRSIAQAEEGSIERPVLRKVADAHRKQFGAGIFVDKALKSTSQEYAVVTGIRTIGEAQALKRAGGFLLFVDAPIESRYDRMHRRARDEEVNLSLEEFKLSEAKEWHAGDDDSDFNLRDIKKLADDVIDNDLGLDEFFSVAYQKLGLG